VAFGLLTGGYFALAKGHTSLGTTLVKVSFLFHPRMPILFVNYVADQSVLRVEEVLLLSHQCVDGTSSLCKSWLVSTFHSRYVSVKLSTMKTQFLSRV